MTFYGIDYLSKTSGVADYIKWGLIFSSLIILIVAFSGYLRHRLETKYRDLSIIMLLLLVFLLGVQYSDYVQDKNNYTNSSQMAAFVKRVAKEKQVSPKEVYVNNTTLTDEMMVLIGKDQYRVSLSTDGTNFLLQEAYLTNTAINKVD